MPNSSMRPATLALTLLLLAGCSEITTPNIALVDAEVDEVFFLLQEINEYGFNPPVISALRGDAVVRSTSANAVTAYEFEVECPSGGATSFVGTVDADDASGNQAGDFTITHSDCRRSGASNRTWTLNGNPHLRLQYQTMEATDQLDGTLTGSFRYSVGARRGSCNVSLTYTADATSALVSGQLCNRTVSYAGQ